MRVLRLLTKRAIREALRTPEATIPLLFIPVFFLMVNLGQFGKQFKGEPWLKGQNYGAFQLPLSLVFAAISIGSALAMVAEIENGYFDKFLVAPIGRTTILLGRLAADFLRNLVTASVVLGIGLVIGVEVKAGVLGAVLVVVLCALFGVAYGSAAILVALRTRSTQAVNMSSLIFFPLLFLAPTSVPRDHMQGWLRVATRFNPVTYVIEGLRSLILDGWSAPKLVACLLTIGISTVLILGLSVRAMRTYDS
jgi:ABC-2 type transport system permease protein